MKNVNDKSGGVKKASQYRNVRAAGRLAIRNACDEAAKQFAASDPVEYARWWAGNGYDPVGELLKYWGKEHVGYAGRVWRVARLAARAVVSVVVFHDLGADVTGQGQHPDPKMVEFLNKKEDELMAAWKRIGAFLQWRGE